MSSSIINIDNLKTLSGILKSNGFEVSISERTFVCTGDHQSFMQAMLTAGFEQEDGTADLKLKSIIGISPVVFGKWKFFEFKNSENPFVIINSTGEFCYFDSSLPDPVFSDGATLEFRIGCLNAFAYAKFYNFLKLKEFADHHDSAGQEIILYSSANGIFRIKYSFTPKIPNDRGFFEGVDLFLKNSESSYLYQFFKNAFFSFAKAPLYTVDLDEVIHYADDISKLATRNFDIVSKQFNFDAFRDALHKEKEKYFTNIREVVNKIFAQAAGVPISIGATVFASYKVEGDALFLILILITFVVYVCYYVKIQLFYQKEIDELNVDFSRDFDIIKSKSGLDETSIEIERTKILDKIASAKLIIKTLIGVIAILGVLAVIYIFYQLFAIKVTLVGLIHLLVFVMI